MKKYNHLKVEKKWQKYWERKKIFQAKDFDGKVKFYCLIEFPYPSGDGLHVGHPRANTAMDIIARKKRMEGFNVLYPIGYDSFGLPTENYAIKTKTHPAVVTKKNIKRFTKQLKSLGFSFDWSRAFSTTDPEYYKWTQWIFLKFFEQGLAYKAKTEINWCPSCKIGLANEEVVSGKCERCGNDVIKKEKEQWMLKITEYADRLIEDLQKVDYLDRIKTQQINWIGRSEGVYFKNKVKDMDIEFEVYDSIPQTFMAQTFIVFAPEHPLVKKLVSGTKHEKPVMEFVEKIIKKKASQKFDIEKEKEGIFTGRYTENWMNTGRDLPIWVASFALVDYGTGIVNCSVHDKRDYEFAKRHNLPLHPVLFPKDKELAKKVESTEIFYLQENGILREPKEFAGMRWDEARKPLIDWLVKQGKARRAINYKLRDWVFSRQRYWGEPIPLVFCESCKKRPQKALLIHGFEGSAEMNWFPWMKQELEKNGFEVFAPTMSTSKHPDFETWMKELSPYMEKLGEDDIIVGHSLGSKAAVAFVERTHKKIGALYLISSAIGEVGERDWDKMKKSLSEKGESPDIDALKKFWLAPVDMKKVDSLVLKKVIAMSDDDPYIKKKYREAMPSHWRFVLWHGLGHLVGSSYPELLKLVLESKHTGWVALPENKLPLKLPEVEKYEPSESGESPLAKIKDFVHATCPRCKGPALRETDVMPNWAGSNWYFIRYCDPKNNKVFADSNKLSYWMPVDWYNGGMEHTTLHLLYSRFVYKFLWDIGAIPEDCGSEPYKKRTAHGLILGEGGEKMSKSKGNVVNPDDVIAELGADVLRLYEMFIGPFDSAAAWDTKGIIGMRRFLDRVWEYGIKAQSSKLKAQKLAIAGDKDAELTTLFHKTIKKVSEDIEQVKFNTAISSLMILLNELYKSQKVHTEIFGTFILLLSPFAPHLCEEIWHEVYGKKESLLLEPWPKYDASLIQENEAEIVIQVNGKVRDKISISSEMSEDEIVKKALKSEKIQRYVKPENILKKIYIPKRLLNIVVR